MSPDFLLKRGAHMKKGRCKGLTEWAQTFLKKTWCRDAKWGVKVARDIIWTTHALKLSLCSALILNQWCISATSLIVHFIRVHDHSEVLVFIWIKVFLVLFNCFVFLVFDKNKVMFRYLEVF